MDIPVFTEVMAEALLRLFYHTESLSSVKVSTQRDAPGLLSSTGTLTINGSQCFSGPVNCLQYTLYKLSKEFTT